MWLTTTQCKKKVCFKNTFTKIGLIQGRGRSLSGRAIFVYSYFVSIKRKKNRVLKELIMHNTNI